MAETQKNAPDVYELMENDNGEVMVLLYAGEQAPSNPSFLVDEDDACIELYRNPTDTVRIEGLVADTVDKLKGLGILYICEMKYNENPEDENQILYAYPAVLKKKSRVRAKSPKRVVRAGKPIRKSKKSTGKTPKSAKVE